MPQRIYNSFYPGIKQDNYLTGSGSFIDAKNLDGLKDGQGITLGPKVNKGFISDSAIRGINSEQLGTVDLNRSICGGENGELYKLNSTDNTPIYTIEDKIIIGIENFNNSYYIFTRNNFNNLNISIYKISEGNLQNNIFTELATPLLTDVFSNIGCPPTLIVGSEMFIGGNGSVLKFDGATITDSAGFPDRYVTGLTLQGSTIAVYTSTGKVYLWDGGANLESSRGEVGSRVQKAVSLNGVDFQTTEDGQLKRGYYNQFSKLYKPKVSYRMEDNSISQKKLDFSIDEPNDLQNHTSITALDDLYFYTSDSVKGIYKYGNIIPGTANGIHKIITQNHEGTQIDYIYDMYFYERTARTLYFAYKAGDTYGVDYIELDSLESCSSGYGVTEVFTGGTSFNKELNVLRLSVSNVDETKTAKLYYRVNNQDWILMRTINAPNQDIYYRDNITTAEGVPFKQYVDIQFKIELESTVQDDKPPMLNEFMIDYTITKA